MKQLTLPAALALAALLAIAMPHPVSAQEGSGEEENLGAPSQHRGIVTESSDEGSDEEFEGNDAFPMADDEGLMDDDGVGRFGEAENYPEAYGLDETEEAFPLTTEEPLLDDGNGALEDGIE